ncbi:MULTISPECIES: hypothetical protein [Acinetobacter]|uniref:hypothetical protein n=1 Tax=Acinetobacter TaxID=469 RepID=UPI001443DDF1|nr:MULTISPECIES: hypothetical protein [Acinetobacter]MDM1486105.1 hypothetical protein [Acinetobacter towneri]
MISTICLHELPAEQLKKMSPENIDQTLKDEQPYFQHHPKTTDSLAINGSKTKQDGLVKASATPRKIGGLSVVLVGENVIYTELFTPSNNQPIRNLNLPHITQYLRKP